MRRFQTVNGGSDVVDDARVNVALDISREQRTKAWNVKSQDD
jgi:hypothetical protein